ncbi:MAG: hypothetical protein QXX33_05160 [Candidatus Hadarchaeales archaeon]
MKRSNDEIRELILRELYEVHKKARSLKATGKSISELKRQLKKQYGLSEKEIVPNLDFLIQCGWVKVEKETSEFKTPRGFIKKQEKGIFKISDMGINYFEGQSKFQRIERSLAGINITNIGGVTVLGDGNVVVNVNYVDLYKELSMLSEIIRKSDQLKDVDKLNYIAEIETIKSQLMKPEPDKNIIKQAWEKLKPLATIAGIASFFERVVKLMGALF